MITIALAQQAPTFENNFARYLTDQTPDEFGRVETVFKICIRKDISLMDNIRYLFYPNPLIPPSTDPNCAVSSKWWMLRDIIRVLWGAILFIFLIANGIMFLTGANDEDKLKKAKTSILYLLYGALLFFWSTWILGTVLNIGWLQGSDQFVQRVQEWILFQVLAIFKGAAFFIAIIMIIWYGFRIITAQEEEDKIQTARRWVVNIVAALVLIKIIDYIFYIASTPSFASQAADGIVQAAKIFWWILGIVIMLSFFYMWYLLVTSSGDEERLTKAKNIVMSIVLWTITIFLFLLIIYQIFSEFA